MPAARFARRRRDIGLGGTLGACQQQKSESEHASPLVEDRSDDAPPPPPRGRFDELCLTRLTLERGENEVFGVRMVHTQDANLGVLVVSVSDKGAMHQWNERNLSSPVAEGSQIVEVNGLKEPWAIMEAMTKSARVELVVRRHLPGAGSYLRRLHVTSQSLKATQLLLRRAARAGDVGVDFCSICMEAVVPDERIADLQCGHGFHQSCMRQWMGVKEKCPLCRDAVN